MSYNPYTWSQTLLLEGQAPVANAVVVASTYPLGTPIYPAGYLPINGTFTDVGQLSQLPIIESIRISAIGDCSSVTFTITGRDADDNAITEDIVGPNSGTVTSVLQYKTIVSIIPDITTPVAISVGDTYFNGAGVCLSQTVAAGTNVNFNGVYASGTYSNSIGNFITITAVGDESANTFTIIGTDQANRRRLYVTAGPNASTITIPIPFTKLSSDAISISANTTDNITIGFTDISSTPWIPIDTRRQYLMLGIDCWVSSGAVLTYTVEYTKQPIPTSPNVILPAPDRIFPDLTLANSAVSGTTQESGPWTAFRVKINTWTSGNIIVESQQADEMHAAFKQY